MKHDIAGWYEIGQRWKLWKDGQLRHFYIDYIHVLELNYSDRIEVEHYLSDGTMITKPTVTAFDVVPVVKNIEPVEKPDHL
jgi:hypothetical protein